ncbi:ribosomal protein L1 [Calocera cornea HHB12733]|uniref:Ribosomal protein L1 n=1 Tax=Calocera cornea HHB12733 TaxID=1353952 RepID=A0A165ERU3_9BASI|nr:ribosomal protein L1 [Calocera cornea HHB12733]
MSALLLWSQALRPSTSRAFSFPNPALSRRCLHASASVEAAAKKAKPAPKTKKAPKPKPKIKVRRIWRSPESMDIPDAVFLLKALEISRPNSAIEVSVLTNKVGNQQIQGRLSMPRDPRTASRKILYFCEPEKVEQALEAGATWAGGETLIQQVLNGEVKPEMCLATPEILPSVVKTLARFLGQKGILPATKRGTVNKDVAKGLRDARGAFTWRSDRNGMVHAKVGRVYFTPEEIEKNLQALLQNIRGGGKKVSEFEKETMYSVLKVNMSSTQGPGIEIRGIKS